MISALQKLSTFGQHHQVFFGLLIGLSLICINWAVERILGDYIFRESQLRAYCAAIAFGLLTLWFTQHIILHVL